MTDIICQICGKEFSTAPTCHIAKYCSPECVKVARHNYAVAYKDRRREQRAARPKTKICGWCGLKFESENGKAYCSEHCKRESDLHRWNTPPPKQKKCKGLDGLEKQLKKQGNFNEEYRKWKREQAFKNVTPIIIDIIKEKTK